VTSGCAGILNETSSLHSDSGVTLTEGLADGSGRSAPVNETDTFVVMKAEKGSAWSSVHIDLGEHFLSENICSGQSIFGRLGRAACMGTTDSRFRDVGSTTSRLIPVVAKDTDGHGDANIAEVNHSALNSCGMTQDSIEGRIEHCATVNGSASLWSGASQSNSSHGDWKLVTKMANGNTGKSDWRDERTKLLWSDHLGNIDGSGVPTGGTSQSSFGWCFASGNTENSGGVDCRIGESNSHNRAGLSLCAENHNLLTPNGAHNVSAVANTIVSWVESGTSISDAKGGMKLAATSTSPSVEWRLPNREDFFQAYSNGMSFVLPRLQDRSFWLSTVYSNFPSDAWRGLPQVTGVVFVSAASRTSAHEVRCIGQ